MRPRGELLALLIVLAWPVSAFASLPWEGGIFHFEVVGGKVIFGQPSGGITVLDVASGRVLMRDRGRRDEHAGGLVVAPDRVIVEMHRSGLLDSFLPDRHPETYRMLDLRTLAVAWELRRDRRPLGLLRLQTPGTRLTARDPVSGRVAWTYATQRREGEIRFARGRLMVTEEDLDRIEYRPQRSWTGPVRRVHAVTVLSVETGQELGSFRGPGFDLADVPHGSQPIAFDGERVVLDLRRSAEHSCAGIPLRVLTLLPGSKVLGSEDACPPVSPRSADEPSDPMSADGVNFPLSDGILTVQAGEAGLHLGLQAGRGSWRALSRLPRRGHIGRVWDREDKLFIETRSPAVEMVDCIDVRSGRPLWRYVFPAYPNGDWLVSPARWRPYTVEAIGRARLALESARSQEPPLVVVAERAPVEAAERPAALVFDPLPFPSSGDITGRVVTAWASLVALPAAVLFLRGRTTLTPDRTARKAGLAIAVLVWLTGALMVTGTVEVVATWLAALSFAVWFVLALRDALRVRNGRLSVPARIVLLLMVLGIGGVAGPMYLGLR